MKFHFGLLLLLPLVLACSRSEYDISEGVNTEMTLFEDEISIPVGSVGPFTLGSVFGLLGEIEDLGEVLTQYLAEGPDGTVYTMDAGSIYRANIYELEKELEDPGVSQSLEVGSASCYIGGLVGLMGYLGMRCINQKAVITMDNPLRRKIDVSCNAQYYVSDGDDVAHFPIEGLDSFTIPSSAAEEALTELDIPGDLYNPIDVIELEDLRLELPANPTSRIANKEGNLCVSVNYRYTTGITLADTFAFPLEGFSPGPINLPIGDYKLKKCELSLELENTLPLQVEVSDIQALLPRENESQETVVDENIRIASGFTVQGGTLDHPAVTPITLTIEALEGTLPDIPALLLSLKLKAQTGLEPTPLSTRQGLFIKSSSARLSGGITIPGSK